jgi:serine/threonine protein kinase
VAEALHHAHLQGLFHRDVKPANILLDRQGRVKVADFGLAVREEDLAGQRGNLAGTLPYMSPEQLRREAHHIDGRTDIYSLGVVLYELLCNRRPFEAKTKDEWEDQIVHRDAKPLRQIKDSIPAELERICLKALSKPINERYSTAKDMADELWRLRAGAAHPAREELLELVQLREARQAAQGAEQSLLSERFWEVIKALQAREVEKIRRALTELDDWLLHGE